MHKLSPALKTGHPNYNINKKGCWKKGQASWNKRPLEIRKCIICGREFEVKITSRKKLCSYKCVAKHNNSAERMKVIGKIYGGIPHEPKFRGAFIRKDLNRYTRSSWEANLIRIFNYLKIEFDYEPAKFYFSNGLSYIPDFYLPSLDLWIEVKGYFKEFDLLKLKTMYNEYPNENVKVLDVDGYRFLSDKYSSKIPNWEYKK